MSERLRHAAVEHPLAQRACLAWALAAFGAAIAAYLAGPAQHLALAAGSQVMIVAGVVWLLWGASSGWVATDGGTQTDTATKEDN